MSRYQYSGDTISGHVVTWWWFLVNVSRLKYQSVYLFHGFLPLFTLDQLVKFEKIAASFWRTRQGWRWRLRALRLDQEIAWLDGRCDGNFQAVSMFFKDQMTRMKANLESFAMWSWQFFDSFWDRGTCFQNGSKKSSIADHCEDITLIHPLVSFVERTAFVAAACQNISPDDDEILEELEEGTAGRMSGLSENLWDGM